MIMAGGKGSRLAPLTCHRAKPAVPLGGRYRIIDFVLSNFVNSGYRRIYVLTQYMASSLIQHMNRNWHISGPGNAFIEVVPAQMRSGATWYRGTADAVFQNINLIADSRPEHVAVFGGDHVYLMDVSRMERRHVETNADLTIAAFPVPIEEASRFGVIVVDEDGRVIGFEEKPEHPTAIPGRPDIALVSMGNYFFRRDALEERLRADALLPDSDHDFGGDIIPAMLDAGAAIFTYDFSENVVPNAEVNSAPYWRDVGTLASYFDANMEMRKRVPPVDMYNRAWPIRTAQRNYPPARINGVGSHHAAVVDSLLCEGSIVNGATLRNSVIGYDCMIHRGAFVEDAVVLSGCNIGAGARVRRALFDKNCSVAPGTEIGHDPASDLARFPFISPEGIVSFPKGTHVPCTGPIELSADMADSLLNDPTTAAILADKQGTFTVTQRSRHSYISVGPRFAEFDRRPTDAMDPVDAE